MTKRSKTIKIYNIHKKNKIYKFSAKKNRKTKHKLINTHTNTNTNTNTKTNTNITNTINNINSKNLCAPFIEPLDISNTSNTSNTSNISNISNISNTLTNNIQTDSSCFTIESLRQIIDKWNETHTNMIIKYDSMTNRKDLWSAINNALRPQCNNEICWIKQDFIKYSQLYKTLLKNFKPLMPTKWIDKPTEWLNTLDISNVMSQYEKKYPDYEFIGPVPLDFDTKLSFGQCVIDELCNINLKQLLDKGKNNIGVVFNLDKHNETGSHWVAMHCSINNNFIYYWDSYGMKPSNEIVVLMNRLKQQGSEIGHKIKIKLNNVRHQYKNSECGVYCIYFLTSLLDGKKFNNIIKNIVDDDTINTYREKYFIKL